MQYLSAGLALACVAGWPRVEPPEDGGSQPALLSSS